MIARVVIDRLTNRIIYSLGGNGTWAKWLDIGSGSVHYDASYLTDKTRQARRIEVHAKRNTL